MIKVLVYVSIGGNMYEIVDKKVVNANIQQMTIKAPYVARRCEPGQFIILIPIKGSERIPMTIVDFDRDKGEVTIIFQIVGRSTQELSLLCKGDFISDFVGPLGVPARLNGKKRVLAIGGGVGTAPLFPQIRKLFQQGTSVDVIIGARNKEYLMLVDRTFKFAENLYIATDDGSVGHKGFVTDILKSLLERGEQYDEVIAIGPVVMMRAVVNVTKPIGLPTMVSLNPIMIDGTGMCGCCRTKVGDEIKFACVDGPDFDGLLVDFDELQQRQSFYRDIESRSVIEQVEFIEKKKNCQCLTSAISASVERGDVDIDEAQKQDSKVDKVEDDIDYSKYYDASTLSYGIATDSFGKVWNISQDNLEDIKIEIENTNVETEVESKPAARKLTAEERKAKREAEAANRKPRRKTNMKLEKTPMPEQPPLQRIKNFGEVAVGYTLEDAIEEATRCLQCKHKPCVDGCPVNVPIPEFIEALVEGDVKKAYEIILTQNRLPAICGRVCPQENQCEGVCVRGKRGEPVSIGRLERFVSDYCMQNYPDEVIDIPKNGKKVAVVGGGPAGLTCAAELAVKGYKVKVFEALHDLGGVLSYGIPEFRLPKSLVKKEVDKVLRLGVEVEKNVIVGQSILFEDLFEDGYDAIFVGSGAGLPRFMGVPGEALNGVYSANEFLTRVNLMKAYENDVLKTPVKPGDNVAVVGGGNVAMDAARTAKRLGARNVYIVYRRAEEQLPARAEEVHHAKEEQVEFKLLSNPIEVLGDNGQVRAIKCIKMELGEADESGRRSPIEIPNSEFEIPVDSVIVSIGQTPNPIIKRAEKQLETNRKGCIVVHEDTMKTSLNRVYAGGDVVSGAATVILAMGAAKIAAKSIDRELSKEK